MGEWKFDFAKKDVKLLLEERKLKTLVENMLLDSTIDKKVDPSTDEYYLIDSEQQMSLCVEHSSVKVRNHNYTVSIPVTLKFAESLKKIIKDKLKGEMQILKKGLFKNQIDLLDKLIDIYKQTE